MAATKALPLSLIVQIWVFISLPSISNGNSVTDIYTSSVNETYPVSVSHVAYTINVSHVKVTATMPYGMSYSVPVSPRPTLPPNCYRVCKCNSSVVYATSSMEYGNMSPSPQMSPSPSGANMYASSENFTQINASHHVSPSPSGTNMMYTSSASVTQIKQNSSVSPTPSSRVSAPFDCPNVSCWVEVECTSHSPYISKTSYVSTSSVATPTDCSGEVDCNGDCGGSALEDCGKCYGGNTHEPPPRDCLGDCNGHAEKSNATCNICLGLGEENIFLDCNNDCDGYAEKDDCGVCTGGTTGKTTNYLKDACGVCNGTNTTCLGCDNVPNSGKVEDACGVCGGSGSTCTAIMATIPQTIASSQPSVFVIGAGLNAGSKTVCALYDPQSGEMVVNTTATERNLTHARCVFQPWVNFTSGVYNLSVILVQNDGSHVKTNKSLSVYYYSRQDLSLTSVTPNEVLKEDLSRYVTLVGSGFFDWKETVCYFNSRESRDVIYVNETHLNCKAPAVVTSTLFSVSLSMDGGLVKVGNANLTAYASAPNVTKVTFSDTAGEILILFNIEVDFASDESCENFFSMETVATFGSDADCYLSDLEEVTISLRAGANVSIGDNLVFKNNVFKASGETYSEFLSGSFPVQGPDKPMKPTPVITGPEVLSSCGNLSLSGSQSFGSGGRPLAFNWSLTSPDAGSDATAITNVLSGLGSDDDRVKIHGELLEAGKQYVFKLKVANFLNPSGFEEVTHSVIKASDPVPALTLSSSIDLSEGEVFVSEDLSIKASAIVAPCVNNTRMVFTWTVSCTDSSAAQKVESSAAFQRTKSQATLRVTEGVLTGDVNCTFNVTGSMSYDANVKSSVSVVIKALSSPLEPFIFGGDRLIGRDSGLVDFDAETLTEDPDGSDVSLACNWRCKVVGAASCYSAVDKKNLLLPPSSPCITQVQSGHFEAGKSYTISVDVSKGSRTGTTSITLEVVEGNPPAVWVDLAYMKVKASDRVELVGYYNSSVRPTKVEWSAPKEQGFSAVDLSKFDPITEYYDGEESFALLIIPANVLKPGNKYRCKLTVNDGSKEGVASVVVEVRTGPSSGFFEVSPTSVQALDFVTMSAKQWITDSDAGPLRYAFGELITPDVCETYSAPSPSPERDEIVPQGSGPNNILSLCVVVVDKFGSYAIETFNITSSPPDAEDLTPARLDTFFDDAIEDKLQSGDSDKAMGALISVTATVLDSNDTSVELKLSISQKAQEAVLQILDSTSIDEDNAGPLLTAMVQTDAKAASNSSGMAHAAVKILDGLGDKPLTIDKADKFLDFLSDLAGDSVENDTSLQKSVEAAFDSLADNLVNDLLLNDEREVFNENLGSVKVQVTTLKSEVKASSKPGAPKFDPGEGLADLFSGPRKCGKGKTCQGVVLQLVQYKKNLIAVDEDKQDKDVEVDSSQVLGIDLKDPVSKKSLPVKGLSKPLKLTFTVTTPPEGKQHGCNYLKVETNTWDKFGLTAVDGGNNTLICESTHATFFAPSNDAKNTTTVTTTAPDVEVTPTEKEDKDMTGAIVGGVIGGIVFILLVILGIWYCSKHKNKNTGRVSPEDPPEPTPVG